MFTMDLIPCSMVSLTNASLLFEYFSVKPRDVEADAYVEGNLAAEISMVALDTLEIVIQVGDKHAR